jgi:hypothetical protein
VGKLMEIHFNWLLLIGQWILLAKTCFMKTGFQRQYYPILLQRQKCLSSGVTEAALKKFN